MEDSIGASKIKTETRDGWLARRLVGLAALALWRWLTPEGRKARAFGKLLQELFPDDQRKLASLYTVEALKATFLKS